MLNQISQRNGDVRMIRTSEDKSGVIGVTNDNDAPLFAAAPKLLKALIAAETELQRLKNKLTSVSMYIDETVVDEARAAIVEAQMILKD